ncbi:hypothetical protein [Sporolactobacillus terrae]|uniref:Uncharacterized protein n=1 Tax=Sporolactobacillus terrae TaxID=269673 RepID=A0A410D909_9BACL|nr:hypothetical protein [Sporolactobacillus terrae]QAA22566.1 hypothetical protein C0674_07965 [Sporolactobacillus terrae]QAA25540.1 hypothetical protein C0679_07945 [Sporolactobacillus terrae]UAK17350.1 hypothetical protein K7399_05270 [Sporolactobacillus terrae]BBN98886.1 hypothetical protein St703_15910 [Sporolactobacillus terrae]
MGWNNFVYGTQSGCGCGDNYGGDYGRRDRDCGKKLLEGISKNDFVKVFLKSSKPVTGYFAGVSKNVLTLFDCERHFVSTIDICLDDVVAIKSFEPRFKDSGCSPYDKND